MSRRVPSNHERFPLTNSGIPAREHHVPPSSPFLTESCHHHRRPRSGESQPDSFVRVYPLTPLILPQPPIGALPYPNAAPTVNPSRRPGSPRPAQFSHPQPPPITLVSSLCSPRAHARTHFSPVPLRRRRLHLFSTPGRHAQPPARPSATRGRLTQPVPFSPSSATTVVHLAGVERRPEPPSPSCFGLK